MPAKKIIKKRNSPATSPVQKRKALVSPVCRVDSAEDRIGKTLVDSEYGVSARRKDEMLADYPSPPYYDIVAPLGDGTYNVFIFV